MSSFWQWNLFRARHDTAPMPDYPFNPHDALAHLRAADPALEAVFDAVGPFSMRYQPLDNVFHALMRSIVYQQLSGRAAATIFARVEALFSGEPTPKALSRLQDADLRGAGLSGAKTRALRSLAEHVLDGTVPDASTLRGMENQEIRERLTVVRGVGVWTVNMMLMFRLGRPDIMPSGDLGIRKGFARLRGMDDLPPPKHLEAETQHWSPWRTVACWYLWRLLEVELPD
ncbi:MAG: DNA-3-methyladenine glycosylase 2 family protein [Rhodothermales bacterium]|nr:DNA-3-methyladenine glycosylase 2 family protein [Rhodothermales bacterium]